MWSGPAVWCVYDQSLARVRVRVCVCVLLISSQWERSHELVPALGYSTNRVQRLGRSYYVERLGLHVWEFCRMLKGLLVRFVGLAFDNLTPSVMSVNPEYVMLDSVGLALHTSNKTLHLTAGADVEPEPLARVEDLPLEDLSAKDFWYVVGVLAKVVEV